MRITFSIIILFFVSALKAQTSRPLIFMDYAQRAFYAGSNNFNDSIRNSKWLISKNGGISTGFVFYKGGHATIFSAPLGLQLNRRLNNNLYAFAGVSVAPAYVNFNRAFLSADIDKTNPNNRFIKTGNFGMYESAYIGLMYTNDAKTFSISGSVGIEENSYPVLQYRELKKSSQNGVVTPLRQ